MIQHSSDAKKEARMKRYSKQKFVYYAIKRPEIFRKVYKESGLDDWWFCKKYKINYELVWPTLKEILKKGDCQNE